MTPAELDEGERLLAARMVPDREIGALSEWQCWVLHSAKALLAAARERDTLKAEVERLVAVLTGAPAWCAVCSGITDSERSAASPLGGKCAWCATVRA